MTKSEDTAEKRRLEAKLFGLAVENLVALRTEIIRVRTLQTGTAGARRSAAARQLGITASELQALERALTGGGSVDESVKATARRIISHRAIERGLESAPKPTSITTTAPTQAATASAIRLGEKLRPLQMKLLGLAAVVFVTEWGGCVHTFQDCHGIQGFLPTGEPDRMVVQVTLRDWQCAGRRFCEVCTGDWVDSYRQHGNKLIREFHGSAQYVWPASQPTATKQADHPEPKPTSTLEAMREEARRNGTTINPRPSS